MCTGSKESCAEEAAAWTEAAEKLGGLTSTGSIYLQDSEMEEAEALGFSIDSWKRSSECSPQVLLLPLGDKEDQDWPLYQGDF